MPIHNSYKIDIETLDFNIKIKPTFAWSSILYPYPGTQVADYAKSNGFIDDTVPYLETNKHSSVLNFRKREKKN